MHATSLLVKPEVARRQIEQEQQKEQERKSEQTGTSATSGGGQSGGTVTGATKQEEQEEKKTVPKRFHASVSLNSTRLARDAGQIAEDILQHMTKLPGTEVSVRLEIQVRLNQGFPDNVIRTVCENCRTLKFDSFDFEEE